MLLEPNRLASYIASKICHDLVSPLSAGGSALDFLGDTSSPEMQEQAQQLLVSGTERGLARLQFLRYAFGSMGLSNGAADVHELKSLVEGYVDTHTGQVEWELSAHEIRFEQARLLMNLVMLGLSCLSRDGTLLVKVENSGGLNLNVTATGRRAKLASDVRTALNRQEPEDGWNPRTIQPYFTNMIVDEMGGKLEFEEAEEKVKFSVSNIS